MTKSLVTTAVLILAIAAPSLAEAGGFFHKKHNLVFKARLTGAQEVPPVATRSRGLAFFEVDRYKKRINFRMRVRTARHQEVGLLGVAGAHIHCAPKGENGPVVAFLAGMFPGGVEGVFRTHAELTDANIMPTPCGDNLHEVIESMKAGNTYVNVHSNANNAGEVRGQIYLIY